MPFSHVVHASYTWPVESFYTRTPPKRHLYGLVHKQEINTRVFTHEHHRRDTYMAWCISKRSIREGECSGERPSSHETSVKQERSSTWPPLVNRSREQQRVIFLTVV